jgi:hypothetical protein
MPIIENRLTGRLYRLVSYEHFAEGPKVHIQELQSGQKTTAAPQAIEVHRGNVVDFHA